MHRRGFLAAAALAIPGGALAEPTRRRRRIGILGASAEWSTTKDCVQRLRELGYTRGRNLEVDAEYSPERLHEIPQFARELVRRRVEVIMAWGVMAIIAAREATSSVPIVMVYGGDPLGLGFVSNLARPGGNVTGFGWGDEVQFVDKLVELVKTSMPTARTLGLLWNAEDKAHEAYRRSLESATNTLGLRAVSIGVRDGEDIAGIFRRFKEGGAQAVVVMLDHLTIERQDLIQAQAAAHKLPVFTSSGFGYGGAVARFGPKIADQPKRAAEYVARILGGAKPGDLPVVRSTEYELVLNLKAASELGLSIPEGVLLRADRVIR